MAVVKASSWPGNVRKLDRFGIRRRGLPPEWPNRQKSSFQPPRRRGSYRPCNAVPKTVWVQYMPRQGTVGESQAGTLRQEESRLQMRMWMLDVDVDVGWRQFANVPTGQGERDGEGKGKGKGKMHLLTASPESGEPGESGYATELLTEDRTYSVQQHATTHTVPTPVHRPCSNYGTYSSKLTVGWPTTVSTDCLYPSE